MKTRAKTLVQPRQLQWNLYVKSSLHFLMHHQFNDVKHSNISLF